MASLKSKSKSKRIPKKPKKAVVEIGKEEGDDSRPGCVYLGHIPHGFYEKQMREYFGQFGKVLDVKVCRSKKTSNSKGYGFVKFKYSAVAKTVAETCHNYLFLNKLLKCEYKPMSEIHKSTFKKVFKPINVHKSVQNNPKSDYKLAVAAKTSISKAEKKLEKLKALGLDVDLSDVMDVPDKSKIKETIAATAPKKLKSKEKTTTDTPDQTPSDTPEAPAAKRRKTAASPSAPGDTPKAKSGSASGSKASKNLSKKTSSVSQSPAPSRISTPKSATKKAVAAKATPEPAKLSTPKSGAKKSTKASVVGTQKSATKKPAKSSIVTTPKSATKKTTTVNGSLSASKVSTPKSAAKKKTDLRLKEKKSPKSITTLTTPGSRKRKRV